MKNLTVAQKAYLAILLVVVGTWLALEIGVSVYTYQHGKSALTALLEHIAEVMKFALFGIVMLAWVLQRVGILPTVQADPALAYTVNPVRRLRNLAIWIVIALLLVFLFNLFQGTRPGGHKVPPQHDGLMGLVINWVPMLLIVGVWIFFMFRLQAKKNKDLGKS